MKKETTNTEKHILKGHVFQAKLKNGRLQKWVVTRSVKTGDENKDGIWLECIYGPAKGNKQKRSRKQVGHMIRFGIYKIVKEA